ncbi:MAG: pyrroline-5-carboxylate reductase dimerization domain-containing protein [Clostridia bacterium]
MKIGIVGAGNIGTAFAKGLILSKIVDNSDIYATAKTERSMERIKNELNVNVGTIEYVLENADIIVWALKSDDFYEIIRKDLYKTAIGKINISFMAKVSKVEFELIFKNGECILAMPTIAMSDLKGITGYTQTKNEFVIKMFKALGTAVCVNEEGLQKIGIYAGCGLGFAAYILECYKEAGEMFGFSSKDAENITIQSFLAAAKKGDFLKTIEQVATKGGLTEKGVDYLSKENLTDLLYETIITAQQG